MRAFPFYSNDDKIQDILENFRRSGYVINHFSFEILMPRNGEILQREMNYRVGKTNYYPLRFALTEIVLKHAPKWYSEEQYRIMPIKVLKLSFE